jgi:hypothetical protein
MILKIYPPKWVNVSEKSQTFLRPRRTNLARENKLSFKTYEKCGLGHLVPASALLQGEGIVGKKSENCFCDPKGCGLSTILQQIFLSGVTLFRPWGVSFRVPR